MAKIGTAHVEIKPVLNEKALDQITWRIEKQVAAAVSRGLGAGVIHQCPPDGGLMPCCGRTPLEVSRTDRITLHPDDVTCRPRGSGSPTG